MSSEEEWREFELDYTNYIIHYATLADSIDAQLFCIGTEWKLFIQQRPVFWNWLISEVKKIYKGKLVYASNWDNYQNIPFWKQLDYIGINAYFPLVKNSSPSSEQLSEAWEIHLGYISEFQQHHAMPVIFTEFGYRSTSFAADKPWESYTQQPIDLKAQSNAYEAIFDKFWSQSWFAGGFVWSWYCEHQVAGGSNDADYTPQNKPAEDVIRKWFGDHQ